MSENAKYPLMNRAVAAGLYHPNCRDVHTTYFEGISTPPDDSYTKKELAEIEEQAKAENQKTYAARQSKKYERMSKYSLDEDNKKIYKHRADEWKEKADEEIVTNVILNKYYKVDNKVEDSIEKAAKSGKMYSGARILVSHKRILKKSRNICFVQMISSLTVQLHNHGND